MKQIRNFTLLAILSFASSSFFAGCSNDEPMDDLVQSIDPAKSDNDGSSGGTNKPPCCN